MKIGFLGAGTMARAVIEGIVVDQKAGKGIKADIVASAKNQQKLVAYCKTIGITAAHSNGDLIDQLGKGDMLVVGLKPHMFADVLPLFAEGIQEKELCVVSIAAGLYLSQIEEMVGPKVPVLRVMPNIGAQVSESMSALCWNSRVTEVQKTTVRALCSSVGRVADVDEGHFSVFSALGSASLAWTFMYIEALAKGGLQGGLLKKDAHLAAAQAVYAAAKLVLETGEHPAVLADMVCSPGGTTIAGVAALERGGLNAAVLDAVAATVARDKELAKGKQ